MPPAAAARSWCYDPNSNLLSVSDAKTPAGVTTYAYENMDRLQTRTDLLLKTESYQYDLAGKLILFRDRKVQTTTYEYDALNRRTKATYADGSFTTYLCDEGNRLKEINDTNFELCMGRCRNLCDISSRVKCPLKCVVVYFGCMISNY